MYSGVEQQSYIGNLRQSVSDHQHESSLTSAFAEHTCKKQQLEKIETGKRSMISSPQSRKDIRGDRSKKFPLNYVRNINQLVLFDLLK